MKASAWVKWRWYSKNNKGSAGDRIKTSMSGMAPPMAPIHKPVRSGVDGAPDWAAAAPMAAWEMGSILPV